MPGFHRNEQQLLACLVGAHRRKLSEADLARQAPKRWSKRITRLAILLRLAVLFNRSRTYTFPDALSLAASGRNISLTLTDTWLKQNPLTLADLEGEQSYLESGGYELELYVVDELPSD